MIIQTLTSPEAQATIERKMAFYYPEFEVGSFIGIRYARGSYGRIVSILPKGSTENYASTGLHAKFYIRMDDGTFREEHPEHFYSAKDPQLKLVG